MGQREQPTRKLKPGEDLIEWFHAAMNDGQKLDRSKINENADELVEGRLKENRHPDSGCTHAAGEYRA